METIDIYQFGEIHTFQLIDTKSDVIARVYQRMYDDVFQVVPRPPHCFRKNTIKLTFVSRLDDIDVTSDDITLYFNERHCNVVSTNFSLTKHRFKRYDDIAYAGGPPIFPIIAIVVVSTINLGIYLLYKNPWVNKVMYRYTITIDYQTENIQS